MYEVELTYRTKMGALKCTFTDHAVVTTREDAEELRTRLREVPGLAEAQILVKRAKPPATVDEAMQAFKARLRDYPALVD